MAGRVIRPVTARDYNFNDVAPNQTGLQLMEHHIDIEHAAEVTMLVRWHRGQISDGATFYVMAVQDGHTEEDPLTNFYMDPGTPAGAIQLSPASGSPSAPYFDAVVLSLKPIGGTLALYCAGGQPASPGWIAPKISIDLVLKH